MRRKIKLPFNLFARFPQGIGTLFFVQIFSTLSYSVLYSTLVLYMTHRLGFSKLEANTITGFFIAFNYGLHFLGGFFGGRLISNRFFIRHWHDLANYCLLYFKYSFSNHALYWSRHLFDGQRS